MAYFMPEHRDVLRHASDLAERIVCKELCSRLAAAYDIQTMAEHERDSQQDGVFAQLLRMEPGRASIPHLYRVRIQDSEILDFVNRNPQVDLLSFFTFIMTHELLHIHRFTTGMADFFGDTREEEIMVDALTRVFFAKNSVTGLKHALTVLDKVQAAPLYNEHIVNEHGRLVRAYL
jgi:hypothetical protein